MRFCPRCHFSCHITLIGGHDKQESNVFSCLFSNLMLLVSRHKWTHLLLLKVLHVSIMSLVHFHFKKKVHYCICPGILLCHIVLVFTVKSIQFDLQNTVKHFKPFVHTFLQYCSCLIDALVFFS